MKSLISTVKRTDDDELLKTLSEELPIGVCVMQDGKFCYVNSTFPIAIGYTVDELVGKDSLEIVVPEDRETVKDNTMRMLKGELRSPYQFRVTCKDGGIVWVMATVKSIRYHGKRATLGNYMEITERQQVEERIRESETRYRLLAENVEDVIWTVDITCPTRLTYISPSVTRLLGYGVKESMTKEMEAAFTPVSFDVAMTAFAEEMASEQKQHSDQHRSRRLELQLRHENGSLVDVEVDYSFIRGADGQKGEILAVARDITERKHTQEALKDNEQRYRELADSITDVFFAMDENLRYTYWNKASEILTGVRMQDAIGKSIQEVFPDRPWRRKAEKMYRKVLETQQLQTFLNDYDIHGRHYILEISAYPSRSGISVFVKDITEHKQAEEKLKESEQKYRLLFETSLDCIAQLDREGRHLAANPAVVKSLGLPLEKLIGKTVLEVAPQEVGQRRLEMVRKALDEWQPQILEDERAGRYFHHIIIPTKTSEQKEAVQVITRDITERKQAEEARQKSEERYRVLAENAGEAIFVIQDDVVKFINPKGVELSGYSGEELASRPFAQFVYPDDIQMVVDRYLKRLRGELVPQTYDFRIIRKDGDIRWGELNAVPISWEDRPAVLCFMGDITERKQAVERLRQSEERYRTILEQMEDAYFEVDLSGHLTFVNNSVCRDLGYSREELMGKSYKDFTAEDDIESVFRVFNEVYRTGVPNKGFPWKTARKDGTHGSAETSISLLKNEQGETIGFRGVGRDITERKQAEEALQHSEEKYRTILEEMEDAYFQVDLGGHLTFVNNSLCRDLGYPKEELMGKSYEDFTAREDIESVFRAFNEVYQTGVPNKGFAWKTVRKDGTCGFAETSISLLKNDKGEAIGFRGVGRDVTERKKAEKALNIQRAYFQQLFDTSPDAIIMMDTGDRAIQVNKGFEKLFGYSSEEAKGRSLIELIVPEEDAQETSKSLERILSGETVRKERVRRCKDGSLVDVSVLAYPISSNGKSIGAYAIYTDITERRRQEQALTNEATRRRILIDQSRDGIVVLDQDGKVYEANQRFGEMLGYTRKEVRELSVWDWEYLYPHERVLKMIRTVNETGDHFETRHRRKDGSTFDVEISTNGAIFAGQKLVFCVCRDVTERKEMEDALKLAAEEWRNTFDSISDAISIHDRDLRILRANKAFADMFHMRPDQIIGRHCYELHNGNKPMSGCPQKQTLATGKPAAAEFYESHLGKYLLESTSSILDGKGEIVGTIHLIRDITEQKRQNERLIMTDRLASIGELASGTAHELNNPLTSIIGFSQLLMEREVPDDIREDLKLINSEAQRAADVTKNLLTFARKHAPVKQLSQINSIIEDVLKLRAYEHNVNNIAVVKQLHPKLPEMMVDYFQMQQVFMNIIINAEYFMTAAHKKGTLTITTRRQNSSVVVSFADDGPGIPPENLKRIFDPFFTTKEVGKGTGLGLSICHGIVIEHGGQIYARSQLGKGATVFLELPINGVQPYPRTP